MTLYVSDLDGTLLNSDGKLKPVSAEILNRLIENGVQFTYATARSFATASKMLSELNLKLPVITNNGTFICDPNTGELIISHFFYKDSIKTAYDYFKESDESPLVYAYIDEKPRVSYLNSRKKAVSSFYNKNDKRLRECNTFEELFEGEVYYIVIISPKSATEALDKVFYNKNGMTRIYAEDTYIKNEYWYEIQKENVSKANAVLELKELIKADKLICFGDNVNDISMCRVSDESYSVMNAYEELIKETTDIIRSNNQNGVPVFIEQRESPLWRYDKKPSTLVPDKERFHKAVELAKEREIINIGTLNEKCIHAALKNYYSDTMYDQEIKIGSFYADICGEDGIIEIQTQNFDKLNNKLSAFIGASHVTIVYPYHKKVRHYYIDKKTGELIKKGSIGTHKIMTDFFIELYRIKSFLNNPNITICIANLSIEKYHYTDADTKIKRKQRVEVYPTEYLEAIYLETADDYRKFIPTELTEEFTKKDFQKVCKIGDTSIIIEILEYMGIVHKAGKRGNAFIYRIT